MLHRLILAAALAAGLSSAAQAQLLDVVASCASSGISTPVGPGGHFVRDQAGGLCTSPASSGTQPVSGTVIANQGAAGSAPWLVTWTGQSVLADLRVAGAPVSSSNPIFANIVNLPSVQAISAAQLPASLGQKAAAGSLSVVLASDQASVPVTVGNFPATQATIETVASSAGGLSSVSRIVTSAAGTNGTLAKGSAGRVYKITGLNGSGSTRWLRFFNAASTPTPGVTTAYFALPLPSGIFSFDAQDLGYYFSAGIGYGLTTGAGDTDGGGLPAGDILNLNVWYQ